MEINEALVEYILATYYNMLPIKGSIRRLYGYSDYNYSFIELNDHGEYVLKVVNDRESGADLTQLIDEALGELEGQLLERTKSHVIVVPKLVRTAANRLSGFVTLRYARDDDDAAAAAVTAGDEQAKLVECNFKLWRLFDGLTVFDIVRKNRDLGHRSRFYARLGRACNEIARALSGGLRHLCGPLAEARRKYAFEWNVMGCSEMVRKNLESLYPAETNLLRRVLVEEALESFELIRAELQSLPQMVTHGDLSTKNIMIARECVRDYVDGSRRVDDASQDICLIDFQDLQTAPQVVDVSTALLYMIIEQEALGFQEALQQIPRWFLRGYQSTGALQLNFKHLNYVPTLMRLRLSQSLLNGLLAFKKDPSREEVMHTNERGWQLLELMSNNRDMTREFTQPETGRRFACRLVSQWTQVL